MTFTIVTNNHQRPVVEAWELTAQEREEFDYLDWPAIERGEDSRSFVRYRGDLIDLGDVLSTRALGVADVLQAWDGYTSDSHWSGLVFRYTDPACEHVVVGRFYS